MNARTLSLFLALTLMATWACAQTRKIGHRSHSGSPATFALLMGEDHLGAYMPRVTYNVDPFVMRVRRYYENVAKENPQPKVEAAPSEVPVTSGLDSSKTDQVPDPKTISIPDKPQSRHKDQEPQPEASVVSPPDFLVKAPAKAAPVVMTFENRPAQGNLWMLMALLAFPIAPGIFVVSALLQRKPSDA